MTSIGERAFSGCSSLTSATIGSGVTSIGLKPFDGCSNLNTIIVPVTDFSTFCNNKALDCIGFRIGKPVKLIDTEGKEITEYVVPDGVTSIEMSAFINCTGLTAITFASSVTSIGYNAFAGCINLNTIKVPVTDYSTFCNNKTIGCISSGIGKPVHLIDTEGNEITEYVVPDGVASIESGAFSNCTCLTSVTIPNSMASIGSYAFSGCSGLTSFTIPNSEKEIGLTIPNSVTSIGDAAFSGCSALKDISLQCKVIGKWFSNYTFIETVEIGDGTESIAQSAFSGCTGLKSLTIGKNVTSIGYSAFEKCSSLQSVTSLIESPFWIDNSVFQYSLSGSTILYVPKGKKQAYQNTSSWNQFPTILEIDGENTGGGEGNKCATPTISFVNGELEFSCETEGVEYEYEVTVADAKKDKGNKVSLTGVYKVSVYATKEGYENSDVATLEFTMSDTGLKGDVNGDGVVDVSDYIGVANLILFGTIDGSQQ